MTCDYCGSPVDRGGDCVALHCGSRLDAALLGAVDASRGDVAPDTAAIIRSVFARRGVDVVQVPPDPSVAAAEQRGLLRGVRGAA